MEDMPVKDAITLFSQSEKIKVGLIWASQMIEIVLNLKEEERAGAERIVHRLLNMIIHETGIGSRIVDINQWRDIQSFVEKAITMINSGVPEEAIYHLTKALSKTTNFGSKALSSLKKKRLM